jgi:hypothetical protein
VLNKHAAEVAPRELAQFRKLMDREPLRPLAATLKKEEVDGTLLKAGPWSKSPRHHGAGPDEAESPSIARTRACRSKKPCISPTAPTRGQTVSLSLRPATEEARSKHRREDPDLTNCHNDKRT